MIYAIMHQAVEANIERELMHSTALPSEDDWSQRFPTSF
jgi:hypothetical protein